MFRRFRHLVLVAFVVGASSTLVSTSVLAQAAATASKKPAAAAPAGPVDLNRATEQELEALPGVGAATAKKIIAGRPYASTADLAKAGVSKATIEKVTPLVTVGPAAARPPATAAPGSAPARPSAAAPRSAPASATPSGRVDLNTASEKDLEALPGVGPATAKKIIAGRPYTSAADLTKAGVTGATIQKITPLVTASAAPAAPAAPRAPRAPSPPSSGSSADRPATVPPAASATTPPAPSRTPTTAQQPPAPGMVWANIDTKVYHRQGDRYYGNTKNGKWMTEADAVAAGYRAAKTAAKK
jgi:DNA uptake protein ComE-like DNA-binding protein